MNVFDLYGLLVTIIATLFAMFSLGLTYIGYLKFKQANKLVENKINEKLKEFENIYEETLIDIQNANAKYLHLISILQRTNMTKLLVF